MAEEFEQDLLEQNAEFIGDKARLDAKRKGTYEVYRDSDGDIVREYPNGDIVKVIKGDRSS